MPTVFTAIHRVRSYECDSFGHVNNTVFMNYLEYARGEYLLQNGLSFHDFRRWNAFPFVIHAEISYKSPAIVHDFLEISGSVSEWKKTSFIIEYQVKNQASGKLCAAAKMVFAFVNQDEKIVAIPQEFKEKLS